MDERVKSYNLLLENSIFGDGSNDSACDQRVDTNLTTDITVLDQQSMSMQGLSLLYQTGMKR